MKFSADRIARRIFIASAAFFLFVYGVCVGLYQIFPYSLIVDATKGYVEFCTRYKIGDIGKALPWYYRRQGDSFPPVIRSTGEVYRGLNLVARIAADKNLVVDIMNMDGKIIHRYDVNWFRIWPDAKHVPERFLPKSKPGSQVHGLFLVENGDLIYNYGHLGLVRLNMNSEVVWRLPFQTHHSVERDDDGNFWVCGHREHTTYDEKFPNQIPPYSEDVIILVSPEGKILREWSVPLLLRKNDLVGLVCTGSLRNWNTPMLSDILHLNDAEPFSAKSMKEGVFRKGDVLVSTRNNHTVFVFNKDTDKIKFITTGHFARQHDPDFIDGNSISVFDNNFSAPEKLHPQSRIVKVSAPNNKVTTFFKGTPEHPFFTAIMGKHQWLPNGNLLITESCAGRAFEVNKKGEIVWEYMNYVSNDVVGVISEVKRIPQKFAKVYAGAKPFVKRQPSGSPARDMENRGGGRKIKQDDGDAGRDVEFQPEAVESPISRNLPIRPLRKGTGFEPRPVNAA